MQTARHCPARQIERAGAKRISRSHALNRPRPNKIRDHFPDAKTGIDAPDQGFERRNGSVRRKPNWVSMSIEEARIRKPSSENVRSIDDITIVLAGSGDDRAWNARALSC